MDIKIYSTPTCIYCKKAKELLEKNNIAFTEVNVVQDQETLDEFIKKTGQKAVPVIEIDGEFMIGYNEEWLKNKVGLSKQPLIQDPAEEEVCDSCQ